MAAKQSERIKLWGIVQGVGFRPYVAKTAAGFGMKGCVLNIGGLVEITVTDTAERISAFLHALIENKPAPAEIVHIKREPVSYRQFDGFTITKSGAGGDETAMLPADLAICPDCLRELYDENNPRYQHPFISCMICGPRYTIIDRIPYDRENTSMSDFPMCDFCMSEYTRLRDRRYHAQTISCHDCGPMLLWKDREGISPLPAPDASPINAAADYSAIPDKAAGILKRGGVILFKSTGGYNLVADPLNDEAAAKLRRIKNRKEKPFAVMFKSLEQIREYCCTVPVEEKLLESSARPILLLEHKLNRASSSVNASSGCGMACQSRELHKSRFIGSFLPSLAAQYMLLDRISPLIFTSANLSDMPMIKDDEEAFALFENNTDISGIMYNDRKIRVRADDSVARVIDGQPQMIRRSKGYAPVPLYLNTAHIISNGSNGLPSASAPAVFAAGSQLKNSFALTKDSFVYMSQFFGDMDTVENQRIYEINLHRMRELFRIVPQAVVCDMHPLYFTTAFGEEYARLHGIPLLKVQHHHAHAASVMAENDLKGKVIGVCFDGTGYGADGCIWGGEFLLCEGGDMKRLAHLSYVDMLGGDLSVKDAVRSALSYVHAYDCGYLDKTSCAPPDETSVTATAGDVPRSINVDISDIIAYGREHLSALPDSPVMLKGLENNINTVKSSGMGRLFDAVSALLGVQNYNHYEGQCAIMLEDAAAFSQNHPGISPSCDLALSFHQRIIDMILEQCLIAREEHRTDQVALTGGTFQNKILMEGALKKLRDNGFKPYYNISVSPNDGGIALGQVYVAMHRL